MQQIKHDFVSKVDGLEDYYYVHNAGENTLCVVWLHGHGSHGDQAWTRPDVVEILHPMINNYKVSLLQPNLRDNAWMSPAAVEDLHDILLQCKEKYGFSRFVFLCGSMGGTGALIFAVKYPELVHGLGVMGAVSDIGRYREFCLQNDLPLLREIGNAITANYQEKDYALHNVCVNFDRLTMPMVFYHGKDDIVMPVSELTELQQKMKKFPNAEFKIVAGGHDAPWKDYLEEVFQKISGLRDYMPICKRSKAALPKGQISSVQGYRISLYYIGKYFETHPENPDVPECIVYAEALAYMLENLPLDFPEDQLFFGGIEQFCFKELPPEITGEEYQKYVQIAIDRGMRWFSVGWDHAAPDYNTLMERGLGDFIARAEKAQKELDRPESRAMLIALRAVSAFFLRAADFWEKERPEASARLRKVAILPPDDFGEALQLMYLIFAILELQGRYHNALARMDQYLYKPFRKSNIDLTEALNMICHIFAKVSEFHEVTNICIGGVKPDGEDAVNELSYLILDAVELVHSASTNLSARLHKKSPDKFIAACAKLIATGIGFPAIMNDEVYIPSLQKCQIPLEAARDYALFGCVEGNIPGRAPAWSDGRFNLVERLMEQIDCLESIDSYEELWQRFSASVKKGLQEYLDNYNACLLSCPPEKFPDPLLSALTSDCIARGKDINAGGAEFSRQHGVGMVGPATIADSLAAIKKLVFEEKRISRTDLLAALKNNFNGFEVLRKTLMNCAPKYGNDDDYVDSIFADLVKLCGESSMAMRICDGGYLKSCMASNISNIDCGSRIAATPDGRLAGMPLSDAASPGPGCDRNGPTGFINSVIKPDYSAQNCTVVNIRFLPEMFSDDGGYALLAALIKRFIHGGGHELQFNVTNNKILQDAVKSPEKYGDLMVRVSGFSAFFTMLDPEIQQDIIRRTAHGRS